ncbi:MAG: TonB-dependent receptor [Prolixibacteraceae bacterium]
MKKNESPGEGLYHSLKKILLIMRIAVIFLLSGFLHLHANHAYSQKTTLSISFSNTELVNVLDQIENETDYLFLYNEKLIDPSRKVSIDVRDQGIEEVLNLLFKGTGVKYAFLDRKIILSPKENTGITQQLKSVSGKVADSSGIPLPGVTVHVKGTSQGTITDTDGEYSLTGLRADATLVFSFVGMKPQELLVAQNTVIDVVMKEESIGLDEVVAVGYGVQRKATLTGSIATVNAEKLTQRPAANATELLQGQIAGLITRQSSGLPGADGTTLNIRGFGDPLVIVDGVYSGLAQIDPNDIESISVLKDAAAAVYGARAGNGVILVTTKRGTGKASEITYHGSVSVTQPTFLAKLTGTREWAEMVHETGLDPDDYSPAHVHYDPETKKLINTIDNSDYAGNDWQKALFRDWTPQSQHNLSARGGDDRIKYFVSAGFTDQESNFKSGDYDFNRYNLRSNIDARITDDLSVSFDFAYRKTVLDKANFTLDNVFYMANRSKPTYPIVHEADPTKVSYSGWQKNPYSLLSKEISGFVENRENVVQGTVELRYSFPMIKGLVAKARLNYEDVFSWDKNVEKPAELWEYDAVKAKDGQNPWSVRGTQNENRMSVYSDRVDKLLPLFSLEYEKTFGNHYFKGMVASETWTTKRRTLQGERKNILSYEAPYLDFASEEGKDNAENVSETARSSIIGRLNYDYMGKYILEVAMRADASAEYPSRGRWGYFPSFSAGWRISEEAFMKENYSAINNLKVRASYGVLGNDAISSFDYLTGYEIPGSFYIFGQTPAPVIRSAGLANPNITWETMKISNIGVDGTLWNGLFGFEVDAFYRLRENILAEPRTQAPSTFGAVFPRTNLNKQDNRGFEITLTHRNKLGDFSYDVSPRFSWARGKYVELDENVLPVTGDLDDETKTFNRLWNARNVNEGQWDDRTWGFVSDGFFINQQEIDEHPINQDQNGNQTLKVGDLKYKDLNGDDYIDWRDQQVIGKGGLPKVMYSLDMGAAYKGFSIRMLWQGATDYVVTISGDAATPFSNESVPLDVHYQHRAIVGADSDGKSYITNPGNFKLPPANQFGRTENNSKASDFWTYDARFLRLKNVNLSYVLPQKWVNGSGINQCVFYFSGTNLFTLSNLGIWKNSFDPEITSPDNRRYPPVKTITFGIKLTI